MIKILLVFEDYTELRTAEATLKKVGFDVVGISQEISVNEQILSFHPHLVIASGKGIRVTPMSVGQKLKDSRQFNGKSILIVPKGFQPTPEQMIKVKMDAVIDAPYTQEKLVQAIAKLSGVKPEPLLEKLQKGRLSEADKSSVYVSGSANATNAEPSQKRNFQDPARRQKYQKFLKSHGDEKIDPAHTTLTRQATKDRQKELKKDWDFEKLEELDALKREFASALFKKK